MAIILFELVENNVRRILYLDLESTLLCIRENYEKEIQSDQSEFMKDVKCHPKGFQSSRRYCKKLTSSELLQIPNFSTSGQDGSDRILQKLRSLPAPMPDEPGYR